MSTGYQISEQDELHYVTFQIVRWVDLFTKLSDTIREFKSFNQIRDRTFAQRFVRQTNT
jgi:hypothetical protein